MSTEKFTKGPWPDDLLALEQAYVDRLRREVGTLSDEALDRLRSYGEAKGDEITLGDMDGDELASLCDHELAGRCAARALAAATGEA